MNVVYKGKRWVVLRGLDQGTYLFKMLQRITFDTVVAVQNIQYTQTSFNSDKF